MADTISRSFVIVFLLGYVALFVILVHWTVRIWLPKAGKTSDLQQGSHSISPAH
jgi:hypothetical protein